MTRRYFLLMLLCAVAIWSQPLPRKGWLGARIVAEPKAGVKLTEIVGGTAKMAGLEAGDVLLQLNGLSLSKPAEVSKQMAQLKEGDPLTLEIKRGNAIRRLNTRVQGRDRELARQGSIRYDRIPFRGGYLSAVLNIPEGKGKFPAVLFIPGYTCSSVDALAADHPYQRIVSAFHQAGYVVLRVEKSGLGDSQQTADCSTTNLLDEVAGFQAGFEWMKQLPNVDTENLFLFGHSMGGIIAPAISARENVKGTIVYGTTAKSWFEYQLEMNRLQLKLADLPPLEYETKCRLQAEVAYEYFIEKKSLESIAAQPDKKAVLESDWQYDGHNMIFDRNQEYWRQIQDYPLLENWKNTTGHVLVLFGTSDFQAFSLADHQQIVQTVNYYHPQKAQLITFDQTDHYLAKSGTMEAAYASFTQGKIQELFAAFNHEITQKTIDWANRIRTP